MNIRQLIWGATAAVPMTMMAAGPVHGIDKANLDPSVSPGENFYEYACGGWMKANPLPGEYSRYGTFDVLRENAKHQLQDLILNLKNNPDTKVAGTNAQKVSDLFEMGMDSVRLNREGAAPMMPYLKHIATADLKNAADLARLTAWMHDGVGTPFFGAGVSADAKNSDINIFHIGEAGLGLGDRDYYLEKSEENDRILRAYEEYVKKLMTLSGYSAADADRAWNTLIRVETEIAKNKMTREQRRNPQLRYNIFSIDDLKKKYPNFDWTTYFSAIGLPQMDKVNVMSVPYFDFLNNFLPTLTEQEIRDLLALEFISESTNLLNDEFYDANFEMYDRTMSGKTEKEARWKRAMAIPNSMLGEALGELYVAKYFPPENKEYMVTLVENLRKALGKHIDNLSWMSDATKAKAHEKLDNFTVKIGYPDKWKDYTSMAITKTNSYYDNILAASRWFIEDNKAKLGKKTDRTEWGMTPQTVNAYYNPTTNEICFPAAILQPPFFNPDADEPVNYGGIGVVIGHEMSHGFDDQGRQFDKDGNMSNWWTEEDAAKFNEKAAVLVRQFDAIEILPGLHANGSLSLGENIGDHGGISIAFTAMQNALKGKTPELIDGFTPEQRFYLSYATIWAQNITDEEKARLTRVDVHSLAENRVNASVRNFQSFFDAFGIKEGDPMWLPESERVHIW